MAMLFFHPCLDPSPLILDLSPLILHPLFLTSNLSQHVPHANLLHSMLSFVMLLCMIQLTRDDIACALHGTSIDLLAVEGGQPVNETPAAAAGAGVGMSANIPMKHDGIADDHLQPSSPAILKRVDSSLSNGSVGSFMAIAAAADFVTIEDFMQFSPSDDRADELMFYQLFGTLLIHMPSASAPTSTVDNVATVSNEDP